MYHRVDRAKACISIHALLAESDESTVEEVPNNEISIHALLAESDAQKRYHGSAAADFYPRSPCGERPRMSGNRLQQVWYFYPRSPCGERREYWVGGYGTANNFYPRSPCGERPAGGSVLGILNYFYPRSPCGERRPQPGLHRAAYRYFYPRSPCGERRQYRRRQFYYLYFYPRSPCGERRACLPACVVGAPISIHALLAESDFACAGRFKIVHNFYPRSPCGERLMHALKLADLMLFLSTLSLRRATDPSAG